MAPPPRQPSEDGPYAPRPDPDRTLRTLKLGIANGAGGRRSAPLFVYSRRGSERFCIRLHTKTPPSPLTGRVCLCCVISEKELRFGRETAVVGRSPIGAATAFGEATAFGQATAFGEATAF